MLNEIIIVANFIIIIHTSALKMLLPELNLFIILSFFSFIPYCTRTGNSLINIGSNLIWCWCSYGVIWSVAKSVQKALRSVRIKYTRCLMQSNGSDCHTALSSIELAMPKETIRDTTICENVMLFTRPIQILLKELGPKYIRSVSFNIIANCQAYFYALYYVEFYEVPLNAQLSCNGEFYLEPNLLSKMFIRYSNFNGYN